MSFKITFAFSLSLKFLPKFSVNLSFQTFTNLDSKSLLFALYITKNLPNINVSNMTMTASETFMTFVLTHPQRLHLQQSLRLGNSSSVPSCHLRMQKHIPKSFLLFGNTSMMSCTYDIYSHFDISALITYFHA